ncbi:hypothetical protein AAC387_Pa08g0608 [Persea americana]
MAPHKSKPYISCNIPFKCMHTYVNDTRGILERKFLVTFSHFRTTFVLVETTTKVSKRKRSFRTKTQYHRNRRLRFIHQEILLAKQGKIS